MVIYYVQPDFDREVNMWVYEEEIKAVEKEVMRSYDKHSDKYGDLNIKALKEVMEFLHIPFSDNDYEDARNQMGHSVTYPEFLRWWRATPVRGYKRKLSDVINKTHENVKYLPGTKLSDNVRAVPDLKKSVEGATMLVFVSPHQFMAPILKELKGHVPQTARAISLCKGMEVQPDGFRLISSLITQELGINCGVLMGANIADEIAREEFSEATVGCDDHASGLLWQRAFHRPYFHVTQVSDVAGTELCGTLKNVVALAAGFCDGLDMGNNTKSALIRIGSKQIA
jgi:glycerol-3-phosphate dehydrogenase (NAD+)